MTKNSIELFEKFFKDTTDNLYPIIEQNKKRFPSIDKILKKYDNLAISILSNSVNSFHEFHEIHNELCTAVKIVEDISSAKIEYEPINKYSNSPFDFKIELPEGTLWLEVKTIHPLPQDDWSKYQQAIVSNRFPVNTQLILSKDCLGGELYHNSYAARSKMLDYTLEMEEKIKKLDKEKGDNSQTILIFFTDGFDWHLDELEDFIFFYKNGSHMHGDPFADMEKHHIKSKNIHFEKSINRFAFFKRPKFEIKPNEVVWDVQF